LDPVWGLGCGMGLGYLPEERRAWGVVEGRGIEDRRQGNLAGRGMNDRKIDDRKIWGKWSGDGAVGARAWFRYLYMRTLYGFARAFQGAS